MTAASRAIRNVLRALAEARDGPLYSLYVDLSHRAAQPPTIGFRIYSVADSDEVRVALGVEWQRSDGLPVSWGVTVETAGIEIVVTGGVEIERASGYEAVVEYSDRTTDPERAPELVRRIAADVSAYRECIESTGA